MRKATKEWMKVYHYNKNNGEGNCGLLAVILLALCDGGMDARVAQKMLSLNGADSETVAIWENFLLFCRGRIVECATRTGQQFFPNDGPPRRTKRSRS